jgi:2-methylcitrate dehydratase PrpD
MKGNTEVSQVGVDVVLGELTGRLVDKVLAVDVDDLSEDVVEVARHVVLDGVSVMLAGSTEPLGVGRLITAYVRDNGGSPDSSVVAGGFKAPAPSAAYANGTMAHALDFDNTGYPRNHPMSPTLPAILALAEKYGFSGRRVAGAVVVAFEVQNRLRMASVGLDTGKGFHKPGTTGTMGSAAACGWLLGLDREQLAMALGIAGSRAGSLAINTGTMTKSSHSGHAARMGVECAVLAQRGWTASTGVFDKGGFFDTFLGDRQEPELLVDNFGDPFTMVDPGIGYKKYPCNHNTHRAIDGALELHQEHAIDQKQIREIEIEAGRLDYINRPDPVSGLDGKFSLQYTTAVALLDGEVTVDSFSDERRFSADVRELLPRITLIYDDAIPLDNLEWTVRLKITMDDGTVKTIEKQKIPGMIGVPLSREERLAKYYSCATRVMDQSQADDTLALIDDITNLDNINQLMTHISNVPNGNN